MIGSRAVIDADVLYRRHTRNLLVWHALEGLFTLCWSRRILKETHRNLVANAAGPRKPAAEKAHRVLMRVTEALVVGLAGSEVPESAITRVEDQMTNHPKDRHVLATAVAGQAGTILTTNIRDFPPVTTRPHGVEVASPDEFLVALLGPDTRDAALAALGHHAGFHGWSIAELLSVLASSGPRGPAIAPEYAQAIANPARHRHDSAVDRRVRYD